MKFTCPNGHKLSADSSNAGRRGVCPRCKSAFVIPKLTPRISESSILSVLGDYDADQSIVTKVPLATKPGSRAGAAKQTKSCPRCNETMSYRYQICPRCRLYQTNDFRLPA
jgi:hypothetical protein